MKLCVLSGCGPTAVYMIERLRERFELDVLRVVWSSPKKHRAQIASRLARLTPAKALARARGHLTDWQLTRLDRQVSEVLFDAPQPPSVSEFAQISSRQINGEETESRLRALAPDVLLVHGAPILRANIFSIAGAAVNVHYGIAPHYRGTNANFWPLFFRDFDNIGVTVHYIDEALDGGKLLALGYPALEPGDSEASIKAKCAVLATDLVVRFLEKTGGNAEGQQQEALGRLFRSRDRTPLHQLRLAFRHQIPGRRIPHRFERRTEFF